jgi:DNA-binding IclR family transcriptional regulator
MALQPSPSAERAIDIVRFLAAHPGDTFSAADLARRVGQSRATCQAVLLALEAVDWVRRRNSGGYTLGAGLIAIGAAAQRGAGVVEVLQAAVLALYDEVGFEVTGCLPTGVQLTVVARSGPSDPFTIAATVGQAYAMTPPVGLSYAAWDDQDLDQWMARVPDLSRRARARLEEAAALVRELGFAVSFDGATRRAIGSTVEKLSESKRAKISRALAHDEYVMVDPAQRRTMRGSHLSAPVFGPEGRVVALLGITIPSDEYRRLLETADALCSAAGRLSQALQTPGEPAPQDARPESHAGVGRVG